ncbi:hypothetical protein [Aquimarina sp. AU474]|uniref:hypothetical protein n=1 Tax=Aquimarina sp. AU474 TaxID=2108529 RepID=UPI000D68A6D1|nr:hypothetical protein [Aquimarina sp. AU474]
MKILKVVLIIFVSIALITITVVLGYYYLHVGKHTINTEKYPHYIGYLDPQKTVSSTNFEICSEERIFKTHHGAPKIAYAINKGVFKNNILSAYTNSQFTDSGYLNFRFIINCKGEPGRFEVIQMDLNLEETKLHKKLVDQFFELTAQSRHWNIFTYKEEARDYYMYVSYKIENGEISEILP